MSQQLAVAQRLGVADLADVDGHCTLGYERAVVLFPPEGGGHFSERLVSRALYGGDGWTNIVNMCPVVLQRLLSTRAGALPGRGAAVVGPSVGVLLSSESSFSVRK